MLRTETRQRARALQLLYAWDRQGRPRLEGVIAGIARLVRPRPTVLDGAVTLAERVILGLSDIDRAIGDAVHHWRLERLGEVERMILRLGCVELHDPSVPARTAIAEALWLAHRFAGARAVPLVNGVLDRVARDLGRL